MNELETLDIMASDMKLWDAAETEDLGGGRVQKTLTLPWGIGEVSVTLEGLTDAGKKRQAVGAFANYIRNEIREARDDEVVTARAKAKAALREPVDSGDGDSVSADEGLRNEGLQTPANAGAGPQDTGYAEDTTDLGASLTARRTALRERVGRVEADLARWRRELKALDAAVAALEDD